MCFLISEMVIIKKGEHLMGQVFCYWGSLLENRKKKWIRKVFDSWKFMGLGSFYIPFFVYFLYFLSWNVFFLIISSEYLNAENSGSAVHSSVFIWLLFWKFGDEIYPYGIRCDLGDVGSFIFLVFLVYRNTHNSY